MEITYHYHAQCQCVQVFMICKCTVPALQFPVIQSTSYMCICRT